MTVPVINKTGENDRDITEGSRILIKYTNDVAIKFCQEGDKTPQEFLDFGRSSYAEISQKWQGEVIPLRNVETFTVPSSNPLKEQESDHAIPVRLYQNGTPETPLIFFVHGGGWSRGDLETHDNLCRHLCQKTGYNVLAVDYRLAPENPFPCGLNDVLSAYDWCIENHKTLQIKPNQIFVAGDSGGGNLVTALVMALRQRKQAIHPLGLLLIYPALDLRIRGDEFVYDEGYFLSRDRIDILVKCYVQNRLDEVDFNPLLSPLLASDLENFPPVVIVSAQIDPLQPETEAFARKLRENGNDVRCISVHGVIHTFAQFFGLFPEAEGAVAFMADQLKGIYGAQK
ncbi:MAG: alpha/beta hydrolase [Alphaproteobacteria bacterium]|nr:alpha/beta hydrolase [Alphaproteobacteria bacterium]